MSQSSVAHRQTYRYTERQKDRQADKQTDMVTVVHTAGGYNVTVADVLKDHPKAVRKQPSKLNRF